MVLTLLAFIAALAVLITVHEYGHYRVAVACGVKVLRFSIGFGPPLLTWHARKPRPGQATEFVIGAIPFGGFVKMLDEREGPVAPAQLPMAFNTQPLLRRALIVAAGPGANLVLAVLLYAIVSWAGVEEPQAVIAAPAAESMAAQAGLRGGDTVLQAVEDGGTASPVRSFEDFRWRITQAVVDGADVRLQVSHLGESAQRTIVLPLGELKGKEPDAALFSRIGLVSPWSAPRIEKVLPASAAEKAGLQDGDLVLAIDGMAIADAGQLRDTIRASGKNGQPASAIWQIRRNGQLLQLPVQPESSVDDKGLRFARIGAMVGAVPSMVLVRYGVWDGLRQGVVRTWDISALSLRMMGRMVLGKVSVKNLSGPITIADYAGKSASLGLTQYLNFLAFISVSLGILNLLPLPVLDGGHLMYYLWEGVTGRRVSDVWMGFLQRGGLALLLVMMSIAVYNDMTRLLG